MELFRYWRILKEMQEANIQLAFSPKLEIDSAIKQTYTDEKITNFCKECD